MDRNSNPSPNVNGTPRLETERLPTSCVDEGLNKNPYAGFPSEHSGSPDSEYLCVTRRTGVVSPDPSDRKVVTTEWSDEDVTVAEVGDLSGSVVDILTTDPVRSTGGSGMQAKKKGILTLETAHNGRQCLDHLHQETGRHLPAAATGPLRPGAMRSLEEADNGRAKTKTTKTLPGSAAA